MTSQTTDKARCGAAVVCTVYSVLVPVLNGRCCMLWVLGAMRVSVKGRAWQLATP